MIEQVSGHIPYKALLTDRFDSSPIINYSYTPEFPETSRVIDEEFEERRRTLGNNISYHYPRVIRTLPKPNCSMPQLESSPHVWHFRDTDTGIEFLMFSDGLRKGHYKGTTVEVVYSENVKDDLKLAESYNNLLNFVKECYENAHKLI